MYCKNCGNEITNESVFCKYCGDKLEATTSIKEKTNKTIWIKVLTCIIVVTMVAFIILLFNGTIKRNANENDIGMTISGFSPKELIFDISFKSKANIENLTIKIFFYDKNNTLVTTVTKKYKNIKKDQEIKDKIKVYNTTTEEALNVSYWDIEIIEGKISMIE